jgi:hypothetical protein
VASFRGDGEFPWPKDYTPAQVGEALHAMVEAGILEVVTDTGDPMTTVYRMPDPDGVAAALDELGA